MVYGNDSFSLIKAFEYNVDDNWATTQAIELEIHSSNYYFSPAAALQHTLPVNHNANENYVFFQPLRTGIYLMQYSAIQYYDPDSSNMRWGLSTEIHNSLPPIVRTPKMLVNEAAVTTSGEVDCLR